MTKVRTDAKRKISEVTIQDLKINGRASPRPPTA
jgi:hypothetical protein